MPPRAAPIARRVARWAPWLAGAVLALGVVTALQVFNRADGESSSAATRPTRTYEQPRTVPPAREARRVLARFIDTAVSRRNLAEGWRLAGPNIRGGTTRAQWMTGNIRVIPFDADLDAEAPVKLDWSYPDEVGYSLLLLPRKGSPDQPTLFYATVEKIDTGRGKRWLVNYWASTPSHGPREDPTR